jgi:predicted DNA-binding transcriptional regulator AlpA
MPIPAFIRFRDLQGRQIVASWPQLGRLIRDQGFPRGRMLGVNTRAWTEEEIADWLASRPDAVIPRLGNESKSGEAT